MKSLTPMLLILSIFFISCKDINAPREDNPNYRDNDRRGRVKIDDKCGVDYECDKDGDRIITDAPDDLLAKIKNVFSGIKKNFSDCEPSHSGVNFSTADIIFRTVGVKNPIGGFRNCFIEKIEQASDEICKNQESLHILSRKYRNYDLTKDRVDSNLRAAKETEEDFRDLLYRQAQAWDQTDQNPRNLGKRYISEELDNLSRYLYRESRLNCYTSGRSRY